jgi:uncharacterized coiled-coil protein SlyX
MNRDTEPKQEVVDIIADFKANERSFIDSRALEPADPDKLVDRIRDLERQLAAHGRLVEEMTEAVTAQQQRNIDQRLEVLTAEERIAELTQEVKTEHRRTFDEIRQHIEDFMDQQKPRTGSWVAFSTEIMVHLGMVEPSVLPTQPEIVTPEAETTKEEQ